MTVRPATAASTTLRGHSGNQFMAAPNLVRVTLTPPDGEPLALYAVPPAAPGVVVLAYPYPDLVVEPGWVAKGRGFGGVVTAVEGRTLTVEAVSP